MLNSILTVGQQVFFLFVLAGIGYALGKAKILNDEFGRCCSQLIMYTVSPAMMIVSFQRPFEQEGFHNFCIVLLLALIIHAAGIVLAHGFLRKDTPRRDIMRFSVVHSNCGFMGLPLQMALLGSIGVFYGSAFSAGFTLFAWTYGLLQMSGGQKRPTPKTLLLNPGVLSVLVSLALYLCRISLPTLLLTPITYLSQLNTPLPMVVVGYQLSQANLKVSLRGKDTWVSIFLRLVVIPAFSIALCLLLHVDHEVSVAVVAAASAPCAALLSIFASRFNRDLSLASGLVAVETLLSAFTMPIMVGMTISLC